MPSVKRSSLPGMQKWKLSVIVFVKNSASKLLYSQLLAQRKSSSARLMHRSKATLLKNLSLNCNHGG